MEFITCRPAVIYLAISTIIVCCFMILKLNTKDIISLLWGFLNVVVCTLALSGICSMYSTHFSWFLTTLFIVITFILNYTVITQVRL